MKSSSSTTGIPQTAGVPRHVAIIMDGNGRWAKARHLPRFAGHKRGVEAVRAIVKSCVQRGVEYLTLFAFSSENWRRPQDEVSFLMQLFLKSLQKEVARLHENGIRFRVIGDLSRFDAPLVKVIREAEALTAGNQRFNLTVAANYGGRWDIMNAMSRLMARDPERRDGFSEDELASELSMHFAPEPDLFIRTGGEQRISNFLLWQLAYTELYFTECFWPDFDTGEFVAALRDYAARERRFGARPAQLASEGR